MSETEINQYIHFTIMQNCQGFRVVPYGISLSGTEPCEHQKGNIRHRVEAHKEQQK